jgi:hypothetical protein
VLLARHQHHLDIERFEHGAATKSVNRELEAKTRALAGWKGHTTNLIDQPADFVIGAYHQLWRIEKAFRMSKHDLQARPIASANRPMSIRTAACDRTCR